MDSFFASVEVLDDPSLAGRPVIVGGAGARGVVASCTYEARAFGIHSAMPSVEARRRCPHAVFLPGRFARYVEMSERLHAVLQRFSPVVEGIALDEAFVDVAGARRLLGPPPEVARRIRQAVLEDMQMECGVGRGPDQAAGQAGVAGRQAGADARRGPGPGPGVVVVLPADGAGLPPPPAGPCPVGGGPGHRPAARRPGGHDRRGAGRASPRTRCAGRWASPTGTSSPQLARGEDPRPVEATREVKSVGHEETFAARHPQPRRACTATWCAWPTPWGPACARPGWRAGRSRSRSATATAPPSPGRTRWGRRSTRPAPSGPWPGRCSTPWTWRPGVRLLGVSVSGLVDADTTARQLSFDDDGARPPARDRGRRPGRAGRDRERRRPDARGDAPGRPPRLGSSPGTRWRRRCRPSGPATATPRWGPPPWWAGTGWS